jgi:hypothetical protein
MDAPIDLATVLGEFDLGKDKAAAELVVLLYSELGVWRPATCGVSAAITPCKLRPWYMRPISD